MDYIFGKGISTEDLKEFLENVHEKHFVELKKASELPSSFWESYSAFANTVGGWIVLGVIENKPKNIIFGVDNPEKAITNLWNQLSNRNKVSFRTMMDGFALQIREKCSYLRNNLFLAGIPDLVMRLS